jgi:integrase
VASITKRPGSPFWYARFRVGTKQFVRATRTSNRALAMQIADTMERTARGQLAGDLLRREVDRLAERLSDPHTRISIRASADRWMASIAGTRAAATVEAYCSAARSLLNWLGAAAGAPIEELSSAQIDAWRRHLVETGRSVGTSNQRLACVSGWLEDARRARQIRDNPARLLRRLRPSEGSATFSGRRDVSEDELSTLLRESTGEMHGLILLGACTGLRLGDLGRLDWTAVDLGAGLLTLVTRKTRQQVSIPMRPEVRQYLSGLVRPVSGKGPVFPAAAATICRNGDKVGNLSKQFARVTKAAGLPAGANGGLTFHGLRHRALSRMAAAGVPLEAACAVIGVTAAVARAYYVHVGIDDRRRVMDTLPAIEVKSCR